MEKMDMSLDEIRKVDRTKPVAKSTATKGRKTIGSRKSKTFWESAKDRDPEGTWKHDRFHEANPSEKKRRVVNPASSHFISIQRIVANEQSAAKAQNGSAAPKLEDLRVSLTRGGAREVNLSSKSGAVPRITITRNLRQAVLATPDDSKSRSSNARNGQSANGYGILVANLHPAATASDVKTCFSTFGQILRCALVEDSRGRSTGTAEIVYQSQQSCKKAIAELHGQLADGQILNIEEIQHPRSIVGSAQPLPLSTMSVNRSGSNRDSVPRPAVAGLYSDRM
ncbi:uncharacterized protein BJ171DRAFT_515152 [Polychytrium aggregatum]|uniref:uncharacterized protein n=1 Tax=Polychytrium aggregatum TaxID=110093 RepID=UPI0022FEBA62|nr:uncharacterized protein BJ171DRAFT_515152 [Polychytrium aggregatum]KAI9202188.1 hypothetical protein BJ171DRAFT_515152 [Polychytrium aggregatum]